MVNTVNKKRVRNLFVRFISCISSIKEKSEEEADLLGLIGAMQTGKDKISQERGDRSNEDREFIYLNEQIIATEARLSIIGERLQDKLNKYDQIHTDLAVESFLEIDEEGVSQFLLPYHLTTHQRTLVPGFNSMAVADVEAVEFKRVGRKISLTGVGKYLVYPTMGTVDFGVI